MLFVNPEIAEKDHSVLGASTSDRWMNCYGSVALSKGLPSIQSEAGKIGTLAHHYAELILKNAGDADLSGCSQEMYEHIMVYVDYVNSLATEDPRSQLSVESKINMIELHPEFFGTSDAFIYHPEAKLLDVVDFKYGTEPVNAEENPQLLYYAIGSWFKCASPVETFRLHVVQPRSTRKSKISVWSESSYYLLEYAEELVQAAVKTETHKHEYKLGSYCFFCPAQQICPEKHKQTLEKAKQAFSLTVKEILE